MAALTEQEFRLKSDEALDALSRMMMPLADQEGFEVEMQNGVSLSSSPIFRRAHLPKCGRQVRIQPQRRQPPVKRPHDGAACA